MVLAGLEALSAMRRISPPGSLVGPALVGSFFLSAALGLACAGKQTAQSSPCLDRCTNIQSSLDRSSCELDCKRVADNSAATPAPAPAAAPAPETPRGVYTPPPPESRPIVGPPTAPTYPATQPIAQPTPPRPTTPTPAPAAVTPTGPSYAELQQQRNACEVGCNAEPVASDRATCRMQCAQITNQPTSSPSVPASTGTPAYVRPPTGATPSSGPTTPVAADPQALASCLNTCNDGPETDRATCRLNCNAKGQVGPAPSSYYTLGGTPPSDAERRAAVIRSSQGVAGTSAPPPPSPPATQQKIAACAATAQQCSTTCSAQLAPCNAECDQGKMSTTDRATCKLTCENTVDTCRDDCRIKEGSCRSKP